MVAGDTSQQYCSIVWSCTPALAGQLLALDDAEFAQQLEQAFESRLGKIQAVATRQAFPLRQLHALNYVNAGVALVGDAAHTIHPLAGQGVNLGFADAEALAAILKHAVARKEDFASLQILSRYQRQRKPANLGMMVAMEGFKRIFASDNLSLRWLRNSGLNAVNHLSPLKQQIMRIAMGLK
jgi:2-octaprenylphenol hydroxylase